MVLDGALCCVNKPLCYGFCQRRTHTHTHVPTLPLGGEKMSNGGILEVNNEEISQYLCLTHFVEGHFFATFASSLKHCGRFAYFLSGHGK